VELEYYSFARDEMTQRIVDPWRVFHAFGAWYLSGYCHRAEGERLFRIDRVRSVQRTGDPIQVPDTTDDDLGPSVYQPDDADLRVRLDLDPSAAWVADSYPVDAVRIGTDDRVEIVLPVSAPAFLERLLLGLGPAARVLDPPEARLLVARAADRILARYRASERAGP
jgi:proteasome accessory factor C